MTTDLMTISTTELPYLIIPKVRKHDPILVPRAVLYNVERAKAKTPAEREHAARLLDRIITLMQDREDA